MFNPRGEPLVLLVGIVSELEELVFDECVPVNNFWRMIPCGFCFHWKVRKFFQSNMSMNKNKTPAAKPIESFWNWLK